MDTQWLVVEHVAADGDVYVFRFTRETAHATLQRVSQLACQPECPLTWYEAAWLAREIREAC